VSVAALAEEHPSAGSAVRPAALRLVRRERRHRLDLVPLTDTERAELLRDEAELRAAGLLPRPATRADCVDGPRPCAFVSCRHHLFGEILPSGAIKPEYPGREVWEMAETCSLDLADRHADVGMEANEIADLLNVTDSSVRMHLNSGLAALRRRLERRPLRVPPASPSVAAEPEQATPAATAPEVKPPRERRRHAATRQAPRPADPARGARLRDFLAKHRIPQAELARQIGVSQVLVNAVCRGRNSISADLARMLAITFSTTTHFWMTPAAGAGSTPTTAAEAPTGDHP
jgi:DNA-binding XRE family transcriptional regulator